MHRQILIACLPCLIALAAACVALVLTARLSGARFDWRRLRRIHACQEGGVQSLAFVLTLPMFIVIAQFVVQVSQLMIGVMVVNYAAFASARSAAVWAPASVGGLAENKLGQPIEEGVPAVLTQHSPLLIDHPKFQQIFKAAALACVPVSPSRDLGEELDSTNQNAADVTRAMYAVLVPKSEGNSRIGPRLDNKIAWSYAHTAVRVTFVDKNSRRGMTYNPRELVRDVDPLTGEETTFRNWDHHEVGWEDPITVQVTHELALLPGPGRFLAKYLVRADGEPDNVADRIKQTTGPSRERIYTTSIWATATATVEGVRSVVPYAQTP